MKDGMKQIKLLRLQLRDFQGGTCIIEANGEDINVYAANGVGKTRLASAFSWLLFDKDSLGRSDFEIKNLDAQGEAAHGLEHSVEAVLSFYDGEQVGAITLRKVYKEIWTKKRGSAKATFTGHTTDYFVNGVPLKKKDYQDRVAELAGDEASFRLITSPTAFPALHWQKQRDLLLEICGDLTDADVIASHRELEPLTEILGQRSIEEHRKVIQARRSQVNKEIEKIPVRIDEQRRSITKDSEALDLEGLPMSALEAEIKEMETKKDDLRLRLQGIRTGGRVAELSKEHVEVSNDIRRLEDKHYTDVMRSVNSLNGSISGTEGRKRADEARLRNLDALIDHKTRQTADIEAALAALRENWKEADSMTFRDFTPDTCAACGQPLPPERIQEARDKAQEDFNRRKAERLTEIDQRGKRLREDQEAIKRGIEEARAEMERLTAAVRTAEEEVDAWLVERDSLRALASDYSQVHGYADLIARRADLEAAIDAEKAGHSEDVDKLRAQVEALIPEIDGRKLLVNEILRRKEAEARIEELKTEEKTLAAEYEKLEGELYLTEQFVKAKVQLLTDRINERFGYAHFKLFNELVNGGIEPCCEITVGGVPFNGGLNNAARIAAGCDVIHVLQGHYGLVAPIIIDNRESVTWIPETGSQVISLIVSPEDDVLRVEAAKRPEPQFESQRFHTAATKLT